METHKLASPRPSPAFAARALLYAVVIALAAVSAPAAAQCQLMSGPSALNCSGCTGNMTFWPTTPMHLYQNGAGGSDRLMVQLNYGHAVFDLSANPASPGFKDLADIRAPLPQGVGPIGGDGQNFITGTGVSGDGQRGLLSMEISNYGGTNVGKPTPDAFYPLGSTGVYRSNKGLVVQKAGSRYIAYGLATGNLWAADVTTLPASWSKSNIPDEQAFTSLTSSGSSDLQFTEWNGFQYLYWIDGSSVVVADAANPGPSGSITGAYPTWEILLAEWGRPSGDSLTYVSAAGDPQSVHGNLYLLGAFVGTNGTGFSLISFDRTTGNRTLLGSFTPDSSFRSQVNSAPALAATNPYSNDVDLYMWGATGPRGTLRLYTTSARYFGGSIGGSFDLNAGQVGMPSSIADMSTLRKSSTNVYAYVSDGFTPFAMQMSCQTGPSPAAGHLAVSNVSGTPLQLSSGATVFVGDTLQITPSVSPPNSVYPVINWDLDFDYHAGPETGSGVLQLLYPDACFSGCLNNNLSYPDPPQFTLVGPCDPQHGGEPAAGNNCWISVVAGGDFASQPAPGTLATLPIAFEAENALNTTTVPLATFNVTWKVPAVKVQSLAALMNGSSQATFQSGSEGHPAPLLYKWYFGTDPTAQSGETLIQDTTGPGCNLTSSCQHTFPGKGTYNAWLVASYTGGYSSPDWSPSPTGCYNGPCAFQVTVTDFVAAFSASSTVYLGGSPISVTNQSTMGTGITPSYFYYLCDATSGSCADNQPGYTAFSGSGTIPLPPTVGTWWLRIKATYNAGASTAQWQPNVNGVSDPTAWPISVQDTPPTISLSPRYPCVVGCSGFYAYTGATLRAYAYLGGVEDQNPPIGLAWQVTGVTVDNPTGSGQGFSFVPQTTGMLTLTMTGYGQPVTTTLTIVAPAPPAGPSVSVSANPSSPSAGQSVTLTATVSGGSGTYNTYTWTFGDGSAPASGPYAQVTHTYTAAGTYYPQCKVTDSASATGTGSTPVTVTGGTGPGSNLAVTVTANPSSTAVGISVTFTAAASGGSGTYSTYSWNFGDGSAPVSGPYSSASHAYSQAGTYIGTCTVTDSLGANASNQATVTITGATVPPDFRIAYPDGTDAVLGSDGSFLVVALQQNMFRAVNAANPSQTLSVANPYWNWGDGTAGPSVTPVAKTWNVGGTYPVSLTVTGQPTAFHNVNVVGGIPTATYSFAYSVNGQAGGPVNANDVVPGAGILFTATGPPGAEYDWNFGDGTPVAPGPSVISHVFAAQGSYTVVLTVKLGGNTFQTQLPTTFFVVEPPRWIVSGLAYTSGLVPGSFYISDVVIENPSATGWAAYSVALLDGSNPPNWIALPAFQPLESRRISNILKKVFGKASGGPTFAMVVRGDTVPADPAIWAFTYNNNAGDPTKGTYGVAIPGVPVSMAVGPGSPAASREIPGLRDIPQTDPPGTSAAYTNIGFVNAGSIPATVNVSFFSRDGTSLSGVGNPFPLVVGPNQTLQKTQSLRQALAGTPQSYDTYTATDYFMSFDVVGDGAQVIPYATVKDVASTDSIFLTSAPAASGPFRIPSIVRVNSSTGDVFRSRVVVFNPSAQDRAVKLTYSYVRCAAGQPTCDNRAELGATLTLASGGTILADDFVQAWFGNFGFTIKDTDSYIQSYLDVAPVDSNTDPLIVRGETYNAQPNGNFGTQVPGLLPAVHGASPGTARTRLTIPYVVPLSGQSGYRTNVALVALGDAPAQATIILHAPFLNSGFPGDLSQTSVEVDDKFLQLRLEQLFPQLSSFPVNPGGYYSLEIVVTSGTLAAYAVINDNVTSDGSLILAQPLP